MGSEDASERTAVGWAARDAGGHLSPYSHTLRNTGPEDVVVKVLYCGICHTDIHQAKNHLGMSRYPMVPGHEVVGEVSEVGAEVTKFTAGDIVGVGLIVGCCRQCHPCASSNEQYCSKKIWSYNDQAAPLLCAGVTVYSPLKRFGLATPGLHGGILGLGGVGHMGVMIAKAIGHHVTVISSSDKKRGEAMDHLAADGYLVSSDAAAMAAAAGMLDYVIDTVPAHHALEPYLKLLRLDGKLLVMGVINQPMSFVSPMLMLGRKSIAGSFVGSVEEAEETLKFCEAKGVTSQIEVVKMGYVNEALQRLERNDVRYRFVVDVAGSNLDAA
nr:unnamed protein product [Digitaria exilis]